MISIRIFAIVLLSILTASIAASQPPQGPRFLPPGGEFQGRPSRQIRERPDVLKVDLKEPPVGLVKNPRFRAAGPDKKIPADYTLAGDAAWTWCGKADEYSDAGIALHSGTDLNKDGKRAGLVSQSVTGFQAGVGRWFRFSFRGLAETGFAVGQDGLFMRVDYFGNGGKNSLDGITQYLYPLIERDRIELAENGRFGKNGGAVWKSYTLDFRLPFPEIDSLNLCVGFKNGSAATEKGDEFYITDYSLVPIPAPADAPKIVKTERGFLPSLKSLIPLGGRWYYDPESAMKGRPETFIVTAKNADRLYYIDGHLSNPFAENMTAWLRKGHLDLQGNLVEKDRFVPDNVVLEFLSGKELVVHSRNLPNHPTAKYPDVFGNRNPNSIQESDRTYHLPLEPVRNAKAVAMDATNSNRALPMGSIGCAINGVCFYNPFDMQQSEAVNLMDRCCGHPGPDNGYHYHKYPVCVKMPFVDDGECHSPLIGFALDGFPIYGPYEAKRVMAKDDKEHPIDEFNMHRDEERGWHYHVTPGRYPYIIGGFAGVPDPRNLHRGPPRP